MVRLFSNKKKINKPAKVGYFWNKSYIEYESNGDRNKNPATNKYLKEIRLFLKNIITDLQKSNTWKIQLAVAINFISFKMPIKNG